MNTRIKGRQLKTCGLCGRRVHYRWSVGRTRVCRCCAQKAGVRAIYPANRAQRVKGVLPVREGQ